MKILFDHLAFWQKYGGVPKYFIEIIKRLPEELTDVRVPVSNNTLLHEIGIHPHTFFPDFSFRGKGRLIQIIGKILNVPQLLKGEFDIYHQTHYDNYAYQFLPSRIKKVTTIHDMNYWIFPDLYSNKSLNLKRKEENSIQRSDHIITISNYTRNKIIEYCNIPEDKISVVYHGVDYEKINNIHKHKVADKPFIIYVGRRSKYKNFGVLLKAYSDNKRLRNEIDLICIGADFSPQEKSEIERLNLWNNIRSIELTDNELYNYYKNAEAFIFPSLGEGFGLPILESMAAGCPAILSDSTCFPEIGGNAALYFEGNSSDDLSHKIELILYDSSIKNEFVRRGLQRVQLFTWEESARNHLNIYSKLYNG